MKMVKLIIEVADELLKHIDEPCNDEDLLRYIIKHGTPLPEHYGRLIDADKYIAQNKVSIWLGQNVFDEYLEEISVDAFNEITPTIIPATKEGVK